MNWNECHNKKTITTSRFLILDICHYHLLLMLALSCPTPPIRHYFRVSDKFPQRLQCPQRITVQRCALCTTPKNNYVTEVNSIYLLLQSLTLYCSWSYLASKQAKNRTDMLQLLSIIIVNDLYDNDTWEINLCLSFLTVLPLKHCGHNSFELV